MSFCLRSFIGILLFLLATSPSISAAASPSPTVLQTKAGFDSGALAPGQKTEIHVQITIEAPDIAPKEKRLPVAVSLVIDRSTSMLEAKKIDYAKIAGKVLVNSLNKDDLFALTVYDTGVSVLQPLAEVGDKQKIIKLIDGITPQGTTFLSGGLEAGIKQLENIRMEGPCRVILLSDGMANRGVTDPEMVSEIGATSRKRGISISTIGLGLSFQENLMQFLAQRGGGQYYYIKDSEDLPGVFKQELDLVARNFTKNLRTRFSKGDCVEEVFVYGYTGKREGTDINIDMGDFSAGEKRQILLRLKLHAPEKTGEQTLGVLYLTYTDQESSAVRTLELPVRLEVIADEAARKEREAQQAATIREVKDETLLLKSEQAHVEAINELEKGNVEQAKKILKSQEEALAQAAPSNLAAANKRMQIQKDVENLSEARANPAMMKDMSKSSKASAYGSGQGKKQNLMLSPGDKGFQVEKLQRALKTAGHWPKDIDGVYSRELEEAVKKFQTAQSLPADGVAGQQTLRALGL